MEFSSVARSGSSTGWTGTPPASSSSLDAATHRAASLAFEQGLPEKRCLALVSPPPRCASRVDAALVAGSPGADAAARPGEEGK